MKIKHIAAAALATTALAFAMPAQAKIDTGANVSDMTVTDSNGVNHNLSDFAGKTVVLEWTNKGCPYVKKHYETNNMQTLQADATNDDVVWLSVISSAPGKQGYMSGDEANTYYADVSASPTAVVLDPDGTAGQAFSAKTTPHMYVIDPSQTLVYQGAIDSNPSANPATIDGATNYVKEALMAVKSGSAVSVGETSPYGCSVKY